MSRRRRGVRPPAQDGPDVPAVRVVAVVRRLATALSEFAEQIAACDDELTLVALPAGFDQVRRYAGSEALLDDLDGLETAWRIVTAGLPVAARTPGYAKDPGWRWVPPLTPDRLIGCARIACPDDADYITQAEANRQFHAARQARIKDYLSTTCSRTCRNLPVYMPPDGFYSGYPCWRHADDMDDAVIRSTWNRAVADHDCPGCTATAVQACHLPDDQRRQRRLPSGEFDHIRSYRGLKVHESRLDLADLPGHAKFGQGGPTVDHDGV